MLVLYLVCFALYSLQVRAASIRLFAGLLRVCVWQGNPLAVWLFFDLPNYLCCLDGRLVDLLFGLAGHLSVEDNRKQAAIHKL